MKNAGKCPYTGVDLAQFDPAERLEIMAKNAAAIAWLEDVYIRCQEELIKLLKQIESRKRIQDVLDKNDPIDSVIVELQASKCGRPEIVSCGIITHPVVREIYKTGQVPFEIDSTIT